MTHFNWLLQKLRKGTKGFMLSHTPVCLEWKGQSFCYSFSQGVAHVLLPMCYREGPVKRAPPSVPIRGADTAGVVQRL